MRTFCLTMEQRQNTNTVGRDIYPKLPDTTDLIYDSLKQREVVALPDFPNVENRPISVYNWYRSICRGWFGNLVSRGPHLFIF